MNDFKLIEDKYIVFNNQNLILIKKKNWEYPKALDFQKECLEYIRDHPKCSIYILTNHPNCFTLGRGLQRNKKVEQYNLIDFDESIQLPFPIHKIFRGGGITFHHPGQLVVYPILNLTFHKKSVIEIMDQLLFLTNKILMEKYNLSDFTYDRSLLGLWKDQHKIASIGVSLSHFVTQHGMALNILNDQEMNKALENCFPCGLSHNTYKSLDSFIQKENLLDYFFNFYQAELINLHTNN